MTETRPATEEQAAAAYRADIKRALRQQVKWMVAKLLLEAHPINALLEKALGMNRRELLADVLEGQARDLRDPDCEFNAPT